MKLSSLILTLTMFSSLAFAQNNSGTGLKKIDEKTFNDQNENCKVDANVTPPANSSTSTIKSGSSSKGKAQ